jgi:pimeloyl-ACP methyl ester carboxylesterase
MADTTREMHTHATTPQARYTRQDISFDSGRERCTGWLYLTVGVERPPLVVLGHGVGGTKETRLDAYCEHFAAAGIAALAVTYRNFGDSGGQPRQLISVRGQLADWEAALAYAQSRDDIDDARLAVWGSSYGGGHAITVASRHPELLAAVAQCPFTDGPATVMAMGGVRGSLRLAPFVIRDVVARLRGREPVTVALAGPPGSPALMTAPDALPGYEALMPPGMLATNSMLARTIPRMIAYRPGRAAKRVQLPILFCISQTDTVAPPETTLKYARTARRGEVIMHPAGHFDFYFGQPFKDLVELQTAFLAKHLNAPSGTVPA